MKKEELKKWEDSTRKTLKACRGFSKLCGKPFDRGFIGELLVLERLLKTYGSRLCASAENGFKYVGSANKGWDISLTLGKKTIYVNAKATTVMDKGDPKWVRQDASNFCDIKFHSKTKAQKVGKVKEGNPPNLFYIFVDVGKWVKIGTADFFTLPHRKAASTFRRIYFRFHNGDVRSNNTTNFNVEYKNVKKFKDLNLIKILRK